MHLRRLREKMEDMEKEAREREHRTRVRELELERERNRVRELEMEREREKEKEKEKEMELHQRQLSARLRDLEGAVSASVRTAGLDRPRSTLRNSDTLSGSDDKKEVRRRESTKRGHVEVPTG
jgi:hypothetical protein